MATLMLVARRDLVPCTPCTTDTFGTIARGALGAGLEQEQVKEQEQELEQEEQQDNYLDEGRAMAPALAPGGGTTVTLGPVVSIGTKGSA